MDQDKVNPFSENPDTNTGNTSMPQSSPAGTPQPGPASAADLASTTSPAAQPSPVRVPVNPYAPAGAPYAPGSNTPPPDYATPINYSDTPAVPNTAPRFSAPDPAYTSISPAPSQGQDIFLPSDSPEKPKFFTKKFIIIASISLVLIIAAIVTGLFLQNNRGSGNTSTGAIEKTYTDDFYKFAQYVVNGKDTSAALSGRYEGLASYSLAEAVLANENKAYLSKMQELFSQFINNYEKSRDISITKLISETRTTETASDVADQNVGYIPLDYNIANLYEKVNFLEQILSIDVSESTILDSYKMGGALAVENLFVDSYGNLSSSSYMDGANYAKDQIDYGLSLSKLLDLYNANGCLNSGYDRTCAANIKLDTAAQELYNNTENLQDASDNFITNLVYDIISSCWDIESVLSSKGESV